VSFLSDGYLVSSELVPPNQIDLLDEELNRVFRHQSHDGSRGYVRMGHNLRSVHSPAICIKSINLIDLAVRAWDLCVEGGVPEAQDFILTNVQIFSEHGNPTPLFWHTDMRRGMIRAQMYVKGGTRNSGAFKYIQSSHLEDFPPNSHRFTDQEMANRINRERVFDEGPGALIAFDSYGIHSKVVCLAERRTVMFEYQQRHSTFPKSTVDLDTSLLTDDVLKYAYLLRSASDSSTYGEHGSQALKSRLRASRLLIAKDALRRSFERLKAKR